MKRQLQLIVYTVFIMLVGFASYGQQVGAAFTSNNIIYQVTEFITPTNPPKTVVMIVGYMGTATSVNIPESVTSPEANDFEVTIIGADAFMGKQLESVTIPNSVRIIRSGAFWNNQLSSVTILDGVESIGGLALANNNLSSITIPGSVTEISGKAFWDNPNLATVVAEGIVPPPIDDEKTGDLDPDPFKNRDRNQIDLIVPVGKEDAYLAAGWIGFKSVSENVLSLNKTNTSGYFTVYPNPTQGKIYIQLSAGQELQQVNIYNVLGTQLYSAHTLKIDISHLSRGMYILEVITKTGVKAVKRIIIE